MNSIATSRRNRQIWGRRVLGVISLIWLSVFVQPCVMAMVEDHKCPHCPPTEMRTTPPCEMTSQPDCVFDVQLNADSRTPLKVKDLPENPIPMTVDAWQPLLETSDQSRHSLLRDPIVLHSSGPPRHLLFCVFLK